MSVRAIESLAIKAGVNKLPGVRSAYKFLQDMPQLTDRVLLDICTICRAKCVYCLHQRRNMVKPEVMDWGLFVKIVRTLAKENFRLVNLLQSGEPFLHPRICDMIAMVAALGMDSHIDTRLNASIDFASLDWAISKASYCKRRVHINVTIDSFEDPKAISPGINKELVSRNLGNLALLKNLGSADIIFSTVVTKANENELDSIRQKLAGLEFTNWTPVPMAYYQQELATPEDIAEVSKFIPDNPQYRTRFDGKGTEASGDCGGIVPTISVHGDVTVCCHDMLHQLRLGNVGEVGSLRNILASSAYRKTLKLARQRALKICRGCN